MRKFIEQKVTIKGIFSIEYDKIEKKSEKSFFEVGIGE